MKKITVSFVRLFNKYGAFLFFFFVYGVRVRDNGLTSIPASACFFFLFFFVTLSSTTSTNSHGPPALTGYEQLATSQRRNGKSFRNECGRVSSPAGNYKIEDVFPQQDANSFTPRTRRYKRKHTKAPNALECGGVSRNLEKNNNTSVASRPPNRNRDSGRCSWRMELDGFE